MVNRNERYWKNKEERAAAAKNHLAYVSEKYKEEIREQVVNTVMYDARVMQRSDKSGNPRQFFLSADTVTAIFTAKRSKDTGKVAALNFASFKNPGGMFLAGSKAQEECLCMDSTLYPVLNSFRGTYYEPNKKLLNRSLYTDRALYTPDVVFENEECTVKADIITCAAPNKYAAQKYQKVSDEENEKVLINRLLFIRDIVADQGVDTLILGAFGCGVFGQDPQQVAELMDEIFGVASIENIVYAVPGHDKTAMVFEKHFSEKKGRGYWMRYFLNSKGGIVKYYDSDLALVQTVSKRDLLHGLGVVKEDYETCKLMEGYYAIRYLGGRPTRFWGDTRLTASLIEKTCGISINRIRFASVASRIQEGAALDDIVSLYVEIPAILEEIKEKTVKKLPAPYVCHIRPIRIERATENKDTNTFDFIRLEYVLYTGVKKEDVLKDVREHTRKYVDCATEYIASQKKFQKFGVPVNVLRLAKATLTRDMTLEFLFELKKSSM